MSENKAQRSALPKEVNTSFHRTQQRERARRRRPGVQNYHSGGSHNSHNSHHQHHGRRKKDQRERSLTKLAETVQLERALRHIDCFEALADTRSMHQGKNHRTFALEYLEGILERWCKDIHSTPAPSAAVASLSFTAAAASKPVKSFADAVASKPNAWQRPPMKVATATPTHPSAALIPFGSYRLGVHSTASDLDLLTLAPPTVQRSDFFSSLVDLLKQDERCHSVHPIPTAYTPVIKFEIACPENRTLQIDLVFARVKDATKLVEYQRQKSLSKQLQEVETAATSTATTTAAAATAAKVVEYHLDDTDLQDLDGAGVRSLNGARVSQMLLESVPNVENFQTVLRAVKQWAVSRGIYSNVLGFLGGVNWAIMTAYVCQRHPKANAADLLRAFFRTFAEWEWNNPVMLGPIADAPPITNVSSQSRAVMLPAWNPSKNPRDGLHVMPIITPAYPSMNSSYNVDYPQLRRIQDELIRTANALSKDRHTQQGAYNHLFAPSDFFERHTHFLQINIRAGSSQDFVEWFRLVESRIRLLVSSLETPEVHAWPFAQFFNVPKASFPDDMTEAEKKSNNEKCFFIGLRFAEEIDVLNVKHLVMDFLYKVNSWESRKANMELTMSHITDEHLPLYVWEAVKASSTSGSSLKKGKKGSQKPRSDTSEGSVNSENTAPATDDEDDDNNSCESASRESTNVSYPYKKCRVVNVPSTAIA